MKSDCNGKELPEKRKEKSCQRRGRKRAAREEE